MLMYSRSLLLAATLMAVPVAAAMAQSNNPAGNMGSNNSATASPGTADSKSAAGMNTGDTGPNRTAAGNYAGSAMNSTTPGATGQTVVPGSTSSQANASAGTAEQQMGATAGGSK